MCLFVVFLVVSIAIIFYTEELTDFPKGFKGDV